MWNTTNGDIITGPKYFSTLFRILFNCKINFISLRDDLQHYQEKSTKLTCQMDVILQGLQNAECRLSGFYYNDRHNLTSLAANEQHFKTIRLMKILREIKQK